MNAFIIALLASQATHAIDIKTDSSCKKLVAAISQTHNVESCKTAWQKIAESTTIAAQDRAQIVEQALQLAREQKSALEQELTSLGTQTKNYSKITWGGAQFAGGSYLAAGLIDVIICEIIFNETFSNRFKNRAFSLLFPSYACNDFFNFSDDRKQKFLSMTAVAVQLIVSLPGAPYLLYKGYYNLKHGLNYKQFLQDKITNLDAIITYLQELQPN